MTQMHHPVPREMAIEIETRFTYHPPEGDQVGTYEFLRAEFKAFAEILVGNTPPSREQSLALTALEQASMYANAAIARREDRHG